MSILPHPQGSLTLLADDYRRNLESEVHRAFEDFRRDVTQLAARLQLLKDYIGPEDWEELVWKYDIDKWFDEDGVPILPSAEKPDDEH